jgi:transcriptional regulator with XRE-family HTH domain
MPLKQKDHNAAFNRVRDNFCRNLKTLLQRDGKNITELEKEIDHTNINTRWCGKGGRVPDADKLLRIKALYGVSIDTLLSGDVTASGDKEEGLDIFEYKRIIEELREDKKELKRDKDRLLAELERLHAGEGRQQGNAEPLSGERRTKNS